MQNAHEFGRKLLDTKMAISLAFLAPAVIWWTALIVSLTAVSSVAEYLGGNLLQVFVLVVCPLSAAFMAIGTMNETKTRLMIAGFGFLLTAAAILASVRSS